MAILKIARMGHPVLAGVASPVRDPTAPEIKRLVADMIETMEDANGAGLAAPAFAQTAAAAAETSKLPEIVVTAERRVQNLQQTPISATVLGANQLENEGVNRVVGNFARTTSIGCGEVLKEITREQWDVFFALA